MKFPIHVGSGPSSGCLMTYLDFFFDLFERPMTPQGDD